MNSIDLKSFPLLQELGDEEREELADLLESRRVAEGEAIFEEGDEADGLVLIRGGRVRLHCARTETSEFLAAGQHFGALSLVVIGKRECSATAESEADLLLLSRSSFRRLVDDAPRAACSLAEGVIGDVAGLLRRDLDRIAHPHCSEDP